MGLPFLRKVAAAAVAAAFIVLAASLAGCGGAESDAAASREAVEHGEPKLLFVQSASEGAVELDGGRGGVLSLEEVNAQTIWFTDRPDRDTGHMGTGEFVASWVLYGFDGEPPNAALSIVDAEARRDTLVVELMEQPTYDPRRESMSVPIQILEEADGELGNSFTADEGVPPRFSDVSLFIDDAVGSPGAEDAATYAVVVNDEEQYSIWPSDGGTLIGWREAGFTGSKEECIAWIEEVWTDMRPKSIR